MKPYNRRLHLLYDVAPNEPSPVNSSARNYSSTISMSSPPLAPPPASQPPPPPQLGQQRQQQYPYARAHFDGSMALTLLVLFTALSFMGFFSIYVRRFASDDSTADYSPHRHRHRQGQQDQPATSRTPGSGVRKGADPEVVESLPVYSYYHGDAKYQIDCSICLGEFQEKEIVKMIPHCQHVFHLHCIDTWLKMHMTCPLCRGTQFIELTSGGCAAAGGGDRSEGQACERLTVEDGAAWVRTREVGPSEV